MHEEYHSQTRLSELDSLKAKVDKMAVTIQESQKRNELLVQEIGTLKDQLHNPSESLLLRRIEEIEKTSSIRSATRLRPLTISGKKHAFQPMIN